ncbi:hypothetical protein [Campylobacter sputorum]|nr:MULTISPECIES: hypothetical protein [unclassified Campylobacter]
MYAFNNKQNAQNYANMHIKRSKTLKLLKISSMKF